MTGPQVLNFGCRLNAYEAEVMRNLAPADAEAVIVIANKKLTWQVVYGMESRGIPAYGAIWDS